jgi:hypothetical protein
MNLNLSNPAFESMTLRARPGGVDLMVFRQGFQALKIKHKTVSPSGDRPRKLAQLVGVHFQDKSFAVGAGNSPMS